MEIYTTTLPLALPAARVRVPVYLPASVAVPAAHLGQAVVRCERWIPGTTLIQVHASQAQVQGTNGFAIKVSATGMDPVGGVRGKPPRGRPV